MRMCYSYYFICVYTLFHTHTHNVRAKNAYVPSPHVVELKAEDLETFFAVNKEAVLIFFDPEDTSQISSYEEFSNLAASMHRQVQFASMTKDEANGQQELQVSEFPEMILIRDSDVVQQYKGKHEMKEIKEWLRASLLPAVRNIADENALDTFLEDKLVGIVGMFPGKDTDAYKLFAEVAEEFRHLECIGYMKSSENTIKIFKENEDTVEYKGEMKEDAMRQFILDERLPLFGEMSDETFEIYADLSRSMAFALLSEDPNKMAAMADKYRDEITPVAKLFKDKITFVWLDPKELAEQLQGWLSVDTSEIPVIVISTDTGRYKYKGEIKTDPLKKFVQDMLDGKLEPIIQSEPIPKINDGPVRKIVGDSFKDEIMNASKDVVLMLQLPWHDQQATFTRVFTDLAKSVESKDLIFAQMNIADNDVPVTGFSSNHFPAVFYLKKGGVLPAVYEEESIALDALKQFLTQNSESKLEFAETPHEEL